MTERVRVYDAKDDAIRMTETFKDRPYEYVENLRHGWPRVMQNVGDSLAIAYSSDKWKQKNAAGKRDIELYKHLAESRNRALVRPGLLHHYYEPNKRWPVVGPHVSLADCPMPKEYAVLARFEEIDLQLYTEGTNRRPRFAHDDDEGVVKVTVRHGFLGGSFIQWSALDEGDEDEPFLFVYTATLGVLIVVMGETLEVHKDGIIG